MNHNQTVLTNLQQEVGLLRSFVIGLAGKDREGQYRPQFVRETLRALKEKATKRFVNSEAFHRLLILPQSCQATRELLPYDHGSISISCRFD